MGAVMPAFWARGDDALLQGDSSEVGTSPLSWELSGR